MHKKKARGDIITNLATRFVHTRKMIIRKYQFGNFLWRQDKQGNKEGHHERYENHYMRIGRRSWRAKGGNMHIFMDHPHKGHAHSHHPTTNSFYSYTHHMGKKNEFILPTI